MSTRRCASLTTLGYLIVDRVIQAYLEFFVHPELLQLLLKHIERDPNITYYAINKRGDLQTNTHSEGPNAVTWGVFPGKEIVQPTIVEAISFMAWKDEAYELGSQWAKLYETGSQSHKLIDEVMETYSLVNVVHNDFHQPQAIFEPFWKAGEEWQATKRSALKLNGDAHIGNGTAAVNGEN